MLCLSEGFYKRTRVPILPTIDPMQLQMNNWSYAAQNRTILPTIDPLASPKSRNNDQCDSLREWFIVPFGGVCDFKPLKWPLVLPTELMSKPIGRTGSPPSNTLRIYNHIKKNKKNFLNILKRKFVSYATSFSIMQIIPLTLGVLHQDPHVDTTKQPVPWLATED